MRLTHIKLAGFKSFVDPTHIPLPGRLIGVVGPNGCGKSNVIDAIRWVLGESSAKHLRGETMDDVIFNGSGERKPGHRASVELIFDNSLGKAAGAWSQYGEISIKRVLERDTGSSYFINNSLVRRRDVADLFLGTGLGARAYAIIEQGMISRIVDARPEELRVFLEEAAGVSKYRERRKETEARLDDTRENLLRVDDIRRELGTQIAHLEAQSAAAETFRDLESRVRLAQCRLWLIRKQEAQAQRARIGGELDQQTIDLDAATAALRATESALETLRERHFAASDGVHQVQGALYQANAEFARIEQELGHLRTNRQRAEQRLNGFTAQIAESDQRRKTLEDTLAQTRAALDHAVIEAEARRADQEAVAARLPAADRFYREARSAFEHAQQALAEGRRRLEVANTRLVHAEKLVGQLNGRAQRLTGERGHIVLPDEAALERLRADLASLDTELAAARQEQGAIEAVVPSSEQQLRAATQEVEGLRQRHAGLEARRHALVSLQQQVGASEQMASWLGQHGLASLPRFWQRVSVNAGWEDALEAVLRERLNAIAVADPASLSDWFGASPPGKLSVYRSGTPAAKSADPAPGGTVPLIDHVTTAQPEVLGVLREWLDQVYAVADSTRALSLAPQLAPGAVLVTREGHVFTASSVSFHAPDSEIHGLLERKLDIERLEAEIPTLTLELNAARDAAATHDTTVREQRAELERLRRLAAELAQRRHAIEIQEVRGTQQLDRARARLAQIDAELNEIGVERERELAAVAEATAAVAGLTVEIAGLGQAVTVADTRHRDADRTLAQLRQTVQQAERAAQEAQFAERGQQARIRELEAALTDAVQRVEQARASLGAAQAEIAGLDESFLVTSLAAAFDVRTDRERLLAAARETLGTEEHDLRAREQERIALEQQLEPMRVRIGELRLKEQEARLAEENFTQQLVQAGADEAELLVEGEKLPRPNALQAEINRLNEQITALGPVNLAALSELTTASDRKGFLDAQSADLNEAMGTLEDAIRRMDRETRERLQSTFDAVNRNLGELFPALFGGGEARLVMTGEEILDSGVTIVARPPGKKNASIQLLSGGEKALTAVSLVFSLFRLNPAPFCLLDEVDAPLDDSNTGRFCELVRKMSDQTQFIFISHNKITMEMATQLIGVTMAEAGVSRVVAVDIDEALKMREDIAA